MQEPGNYLLMKSEVGKIRPSFHTLPPSDFIYGKHFPEDEEGAGTMIRHWKYHVSSESPRRANSFISMNNLSVSKGHCTPSQVSKFRKTFSLTSLRGRSSSTKESILFNKTFGRPLKPSTPIKAVLSNFYGNFSAANKDSSSTHKQFLSTGSIKNPTFESGSRKPQQNLHLSFKMKKFLNVKSKIDCTRLKSIVS